MLATEEFDPGDRYFLEVEFPGPALDGDPAGGIDELMVPTASGPVRFRGYIDRLGLHPDGSFSVLDYKTGRVLDLEDGEIGDGTDLQLPLYMLAGAQALGLPVEKGSAAYEFVSRRNRYSRITLTGDELQAQRARFQQVMDEIARGVATGDFHAQPSSDSCRYCDFKLLCGRGREKALKLKEADPHIERFMHDLRGDTEWEPGAE
jgi:RecB family exonuclease